ncbi:hypothetical protein J2Y40_004530 [Chryseobacterium sp. 2987]|nr:hypothetical protein [Chryseobacterium sp. 2987]
MSVLNVVRNKLIHRIMAVIKRNEPFLPKDKFLSNKNNFTRILTWESLRFPTLLMKGAKKIPAKTRML